MWVSLWKLRIPGGCTKIDLAARNDFLFFSVFLLLYSIEQEKDREKEKVGGRQVKLNEKNGDRDLGLEIKKRRHFFVGRTTRKFCSGGDKMRNASGHQCKVKMSGSKKKVNENTHEISYKKRVTKKCLEVLRCSSAKQRQRKVQKKLLHVQSCFFAR